MLNGADVRGKVDAMDGSAEKQVIDSVEGMRRELDRRSSAKVYQLPFWPDPARGIPNEFIRSALFAAIQAQGRGYLDNALIASQDGYSILFTGQRLDQSHLDVFEGVMHIARGVHEGNWVCFSGYRLLRLIGRSTGNSDYAWLHRTLKHLTATAVEIRDMTGKRLFWGSLLPRGKADETTAHTQYTVEINRDLAALFDRGFTQVDWGQRRRLRRKPLAQWLHLYYSSHAKPHSVSVAWLRDKSGSKTAALAAFRQHLKTALDEIKAVEVIESWQIVDDLVQVVRKPTSSQQRYIARQG